MVSVKKIMTKGIEKKDANTSVNEAANIMKEKKIGSIMVEQDKELIGIITETDIVRSLVAEDKDPKTTQIKTIMSKPIFSIDINKTIIDANDLMDKHGIRHLAVTENNKIVGLVSCRDMMRPIQMDGEEW